MTLEQKVEELEQCFAASQRAARARPWGRPARLPPHPVTHSDRHPDDPDAREHKEAPSGEVERASFAPSQASEVLQMAWRHFCGPMGGSDLGDPIPRSAPRQNGA